MYAVLLHIGEKWTWYLIYSTILLRNFKNCEEMPQMSFCQLIHHQKVWPVKDANRRSKMNFTHLQALCIPFWPQAVLKISPGTKAFHKSPKKLVPNTEICSVAFYFVIQHMRKTGWTWERENLYKIDLTKDFNMLLSLQYSIAPNKQKH